MGGFRICFESSAPAENLPPFVGPLKNDEDEEYRICLIWVFKYEDGFYKTGLRGGRLEKKMTINEEY